MALKPDLRPAESKVLQAEGRGFESRQVHSLASRREIRTRAIWWLTLLAVAMAIMFARLEGFFHLAGFFLGVIMLDFFWCVFLGEKGLNAPLIWREGLHSKYRILGRAVDA